MEANTKAESRPETDASPSVVDLEENSAPNLVQDDRNNSSGQNSEDADHHGQHLVEEEQVDDAYLENAENRPPPAVIDRENNTMTSTGGGGPDSVNDVDLSASMLTAPDDGLLMMMDDDDHDNNSNNLVASPLPVSPRGTTTMLGPHREEPTLKEKLVDRERQRRKEAERARLKRQFALINNGGGMVYDNDNDVGNNDNNNNGGNHNHNNNPNHNTFANNNNAGNNSVCGTVGEESSVAAHADLDDSMNPMSSPSPHHRGGGGGVGGDGRNPDGGGEPLGYTMERFLQERGGGGGGGGTPQQEQQQPQHEQHQPSPHHRAVSTSSSVIREETMEELTSTETPPDKGVVMERFLNDPVLVDTIPTLPEEGEQEPLADRQPDDVHRSVSFDMELRTSSQMIPGDNNNDANGNDGDDNDNAMGGPSSSSINTNNATRGTTTPDIERHLPLGVGGGGGDETQSNASVRVHVAPEDNHHVLDSVSPGGLPSSVAPRMDRSLGGSVSVASSTNAMNNEEVDDSETTDGDRGRGGGARGGDSVDDDEPRVLRLTEAEIQELTAIEEASIGNAPPSDRDAESLVGELIGEFGAPSATGNDLTGSQGTPTTAMESGSILSGNHIGAHLPSSSRQDRNHHNENHHHHHHRMSDMDDDMNMDQNSIDDMATSASVSSHLVVSPGASLSGSDVSVTANPPSEIIGRGEPASTILDGEDDDDDHHEPPPPPVVVGSPSSPRPPQLSSSPPRVVVAETNTTTSNNNRDQDLNHALQIQEELKAVGPDAAGIVNRRQRPGMVPDDSRMQRIVSLPDRLHTTNSAENTPRNNRTVEEFDFDKNDHLLSPRSHLSDSIRDLPGDDFWGSPDRKMMSVSPIQRNNRALREVPPSNTSDALKIPNMEPSLRSHQKPLLTLAEEETSPLPPSVIAAVQNAFTEMRTNSNSTVDAKDSEVYIRGDILSKAFPKRLLPLVMTCLIEIPVMRIISGGSDRLCALLGRQHQQLLIGMIPLIAAVSGNIGSQARSLTTKAIDHGHISATAYATWVLEECKVSAFLGLGIGALVGGLAFSFASGSLSKSISLSLVAAVAQFICATSAGCTGTIMPLVTHYVLKRNARAVSGLLESAIHDLVSAFVTATLCYYLLWILVSPSTDPNDSCMAS